MKGTSKYSYPAEKFGVARGVLMAPHPQGVAASYASAFHECQLGLMDLDLDGLDSDDVQGWIETVRQTMDTTGIEDDSGVGTWMLKAEGLSVDEQHEFSRVIDELASWFNWKFWGNE